jgi:hypothetical protein
MPRLSPVEAFLRSPSCWILLLGVLLGCDRGPQLYPVTGKVSFQGAPPEGATVVFVPTSGENAKNASGAVQADGSYSLETYPHGPGAFPGDYLIAVTWFPSNAREQENPINKLPAKYADSTVSGLKATVQEGPTEIPVLELTP